MKRRDRYGEGDWVAVPLQEQRAYAVGLIARVAPDRKVLIGYFFPPVYAAVPDLAALPRFRPSDAVLVCLFGALGLMSGEWNVLGRWDDWHREEWPMPDFGRYVEPNFPAWRVRYDPDNPNSVPRLAQITFEEAKALPRDSVLGSGAVAKRLAKLMGITPPGAVPAQMLHAAHPPRVWHYAYFQLPGQAQRAAHRLRQAGYHAEVTQPGERWLAVISHDLPDGEEALLTAANCIVSVVEAEGGDYDGWERETTTAGRSREH